MFKVSHKIYLSSGRGEKPQNCHWKNKKKEKERNFECVQRNSQSLRKLNPWAAQGLDVPWCFPTALPGRIHSQNAELLQLLLHAQKPQVQKISLGS